jgi:magnesium transporter
VGWIKGWCTEPLSGRSLDGTEYTPRAMADGTAATVTCLVRSADGTLRRLRPGGLATISNAREQPGTLVWLDIADPGPSEMRLLEREFSLHPLALEDIAKQRQRPKVDAYEGQVILVAHEVELPDAEASSGDAQDESDDPSADAATALDHRLLLHELHLVAGSGYLVTIHWGASAAIDATRRRFEARPAVLGASVAMLLYSVLDTIVDGYFPLIDRISDRIEEIETAVLESSSHGTLRDVLREKRKLLELRRVITPMRDVANTLLRREVELIEETAVPYYQDLYDHLVRVLDALDLYRDLVASTLDASLSVTSNNLAAVMKRLTAYTVIIAVPTLIASIYGMNFVVMPELRWPLGYPAVLLTMVIAVVLLFRYFRTRDWF